MTTTTTALPHEIGGVRACARRARLALFVLALLGLSGADEARRAPSLGLSPAVDEAPAPDLLAAYIAAVQSDASPAYAITHADRALRAESPAQGFASEFREDGITLAPRGDGARVRLTPARYGCSGALVDLPPATPTASGNRVSYRHELPSADPLVSWYVNGPFGLEQGFTFPSDPCARSGAAARAPGVVLELAIGGGLTATSDEGARGATLRDARGRAMMRYTDLRAIDARGRELSARVEAEGARLALRVDAEGAAYPVTVDPLIWTEQKPITTTNASASFGSAVMYESSLQIIGAPEEDNPYGGAVYIYDFGGKRFTKLVPSDGAPGDHFGASVGLDWNTKTIIVGAPLHDDPDAGEDAGAVYMFTTTPGANEWHEAGKLAPTDKLAAGDHFGEAVSASPKINAPNGIKVSRVVVGAPRHDEGSAEDAGAAYAFLLDTAPATGTKLTPPDKLVAGDHFGEAVSAAYEQIVVGAPGRNEGTGAAYVVEILPDDSIPPLIALTPSKGLAPHAGFGSALGSPFTGQPVALVGAPHDNNDNGAVHVFDGNTKPTPWGAIATITAADGAPGDEFGAAVAAVDYKALIGAPQHSTGTSKGGAAYLFVGASLSSDFTLISQMTPTQPGIERMGSSVFFRFTDLLVGAPHVGPDTDGISGSALRYTSDGKVFSMRLTPRSESVISKLSPPAIAISGDTAIIGAPLDGDFLDATGAAYVFIRTNEGWTRQARLTASDEATAAHFGKVVALDGDVAVIGAPDYPDKVSGHTTGAAYVFERAGNTWRRPVKLSAPGPGGNDAFGAAVAVSDGAVFVGAPQHSLDSNALNVGAAYVFNQAEAWRTAHELTRGDAAAGDRFGAAIAASQARVLVGSPGHTISGAAYLFHSSGSDWSLEGTLLPDDPSDADAAINFGAAVALASDLALVGAPDHSDADITSAGAAYVFRAKSNAWTKEEILHADKSVQSSRFGAALALLGAGSSPGAPTQTIAAIGAPGSTDDEAVPGAAYSFTFDSVHWSKPSSLIRKSGTVSGFGAAVALTPSSVLVSSPQKDMPAIGIVYAFGSSDGPNAASDTGAAGAPCTIDADCQSHACAAGVCSATKDVSFYSCAAAAPQPHPTGGTSLPLSALGVLGLTIAIRRRAVTRRGRSCA